MVARLIEGWESSTVLADYAGKWTWAINPTVGPAAGRFGNGARLTSTSNYFQRLLDNQATWILGFAFRGSSVSGGDALCAFLDGATVHCGIGVASGTGQLFAWRGTTGTVLATGPALTPNTWSYLEVKVTIHDTAGVFVVRVNGTTVINLSGVDTRNAANASANVVRIGATLTLGSVVFDYDDVYVFDASGSTNNDFAGDCRVQQVLPTGAGATTAWTPSAGNNYQCVDEAPPNGDADYVSSATAGQTDTYAFGDLAVTGTVKAVQATAVCRKDDAGSRSIALVARPGGTDRVGATQAVADTYTAMTEIWNTNPDTAAPWTASEVNASSFGVRLIA
jgi:hypothetical protein